MAKIPTLARTHPEIEKRIHAALEDLRAKQTEPTTHVRLSGIGRCVRDLWAQHHGIPDERPPGGQALMTFDVGSSIETSVTEWLEKAGYAISTRNGDNQWRVTMEGGIGIGHLDGMIQWGSPREKDWRLLEVKTAKAKRFEELLAAGSYRAWNAGYYDQVQAYMGASQGSMDTHSLSDCLVVVVCKDDARIWSEMIRLDLDHYAKLEERARVALGEEMPNRPAEARGKSSAFCKWCSRNAWCYSALAGVEFDG